MAELAATVGLVFVSHSAKIADGLTDLAGQMASSVTLVAAGGTDAGGIGTSFDKVTAAISAADSGAGVVVLCDLGSAILTAETAWDFLDQDAQKRVRIVNAPLVEGGVAAAVAAEGGKSLSEVQAAAESARGGSTAALDAGLGDETGQAPVAEKVRLPNPEGLHARPAAEFVKLAGGFDAQVTVNGVDARSLLAIMALGLTRGDEMTLSASGRDARAALTALVELIRSGFGELPVEGNGAG